MLKPFTTKSLEIRQLQIQDAPELVSITDTPAVSRWMAFMEGGFPLEKAKALIAMQDETKEYILAVRLLDGILIGAMGLIDHPDGSVKVGYWFGVDYQGRPNALGISVSGSWAHEARNGRRTTSWSKTTENGSSKTSSSTAVVTSIV